MKDVPKQRADWGLEHFEVLVAFLNKQITISQFCKIMDVAHNNAGAKVYPMLRQAISVGVIEVRFIHKEIK